MTVRRRISLIGFGFAAAATTGACTSSDPRRVAAVDGGERAVARPVADASSDEAGFDATSLPYVDSGAPYEGPTPPANCVAPCVWEMVKRCVPAMDACVEDTLHDPSGALPGSITCDPLSGWSIASPGGSEGNLFGAAGSVTYSRNGMRCLSTFERVDSSGKVSLRSYGDGVGHEAVQTGASILGAAAPSMVYCGIDEAEFLAHLAPNPDGGPMFPSSVSTYAVDPSRPECAPWGPNGEPVAAACKSTATGHCSQPATP